MFGWFRRWRRRRRNSYRCDGCGEVVARRESRAAPRCRVVEIEKCGDLWPRVRATVVDLLCPACTAGREESAA